MDIPKRENKKYFLKNRCGSLSEVLQNVLLTRLRNLLLAIFEKDLKRTLKPLVSGLGSPRIGVLIILCDPAYVMYETTNGDVNI